MHNITLIAPLICNQYVFFVVEQS